MFDGMQESTTRVPIVDDEPAIRTPMSLVLTGLGYRVLSAEEGFSALDEIRNDIYDIIFSDLNLPVCSVSSYSQRFAAVIPRSRWLP